MATQHQQLFIPERINVGFQNRHDTYTKKLAYVIYWDQTGKLRKEVSWNGWRDKKIPAKEFKNEPTTGFVLNKGVGGARQSYGWNTRNEYIRVWDPRDFEFEISVANLLFILRECDCTKGKGLEGEFVYAWGGTELILLPVISTDYQQSRKFTELQGSKVGAKNLVVGRTYVTKKQEERVYLGRLDYFFHLSDPYGYRSNQKKAPTTPEESVEKRRLFWDLKAKAYVAERAVSNYASLLSEEEHPELAELLEAYYKGPHGSRPKELFLKPQDQDSPNHDRGANSWPATYFYEDLGDGCFLQWKREYAYQTGGKEHLYATAATHIRIDRGVLLQEGLQTDRDRYESGARYISYPPGFPGDRKERSGWGTYPYTYGGTAYRHQLHERPWVGDQPQDLYVRMESGSELFFHSYDFQRN